MTLRFDRRGLSPPLYVIDRQGKRLPMAMDGIPKPFDATRDILELAPGATWAQEVELFRTSFPDKMPATIFVQAFCVPMEEYANESQVFKRPIFSDLLEIRIER